MRNVIFWLLRWLLFPFVVLDSWKVVRAEFVADYEQAMFASQELLGTINSKRTGWLKARSLLLTGVDVSRRTEDNKWHIVCLALVFTDGAEQKVHPHASFYRAVDWGFLGYVFWQTWDTYYRLRPRWVPHRALYIEFTLKGQWRPACSALTLEEMRQQDA